jgi:hypothetical protein
MRTESDDREYKSKRQLQFAQCSVVYQYKQDRHFFHHMRLLLWKSNNTTRYECAFVPLVIQQAMLMRRIILPFVVCLALLYVSTLSQKWHDIWEKNH